MIRYLSRRALSGLVSLFIFVTVMFFVTEIMIPGDFTDQFSLSLNRAQRAQLAHELGIDRPLLERYFNWLGRLLRGSLGPSFYGGSVAEALGRMLPYTLLVFFTGTAIAFLLGQWLGKVVAWRRAGFLSGTATLSGIGLYTTFPPWLSFLVLYFFARRFRLFVKLFNFEPSYELSIQRSPEIWGASTLSVETVMFYTVVTLVAVALMLVITNRVLERKLRWRLPALLHPPLLLAGWLGSCFALGFGVRALDVLFHAALPLVTYVLLSFGETMLIMQISMMDTLKEDYVSLARAKGLPEHVVRDRHAARNALLPVLSRLVISLPYLLTGLVIIEQRFSWPGISSALFLSFYGQDIPMVVGALLVVGLFSTLARLFLDALQVYLDPRIRYDVGQPGRLG